MSEIIILQYNYTGKLYSGIVELADSYLTGLNYVVMFSLFLTEFVKLIIDMQYCSVQRGL